MSHVFLHDYDDGCQRGNLAKLWGKQTKSLVGLRMENLWLYGNIWTTHCLVSWEGKKCFRAATFYYCPERLEIISMTGLKSTWKGKVREINKIKFYDYRHAKGKRLSRENVLEMRIENQKKKKKTQECLKWKNRKIFHPARSARAWRFITVCF